MTAADITKPSRPRVCAVRTKAMQLATQRQADGINNPLLQRESRTTCTHVGTVLARMTRAGDLVGVTVVGRLRHWFVSEQAAQQWAARHPPQPKATPTPKQQLVIRQRPAQPAPVTLRRQARDGEPIITADTKVTIDSRQWPTARWQMQPPAQANLWASFAGTRPGVNPDTGKPWAAAA